MNKAHAVKSHFENKNLSTTKPNSEWSENSKICNATNYNDIFCRCHLNGILAEQKMEVATCRPFNIEDS